MAKKITKPKAKHKQAVKAKPAPKRKEAAPASKDGVNPMWGGQFKYGPAAIMAKINASIGFDKKLAPQDIKGSLAHSSMLAATGILSLNEAVAIEKGLNDIAKEIGRGDFRFREDLEDIHMNIESRLAELIGDAAGKLHTARSRNDQVALDFRLFVRDAGHVVDGLLKALQAALIKRAEEYVDAVMPGFTHLQTAQPVTFGHHLMAYVEMFGRDRRRIKDMLAGLDECPLGAAALAGTSFPINRHMTAKALGFSAPMANSLDAVSDRDFALEFLSAASISAIHLSRLSEELILWSSAPFGFVKLSDLFVSGSSIMPQKRNPDAAELVRGKSGRIMGGLTSLLVTMKGLPLAYNKDMREDKEPVFEVCEQWQLCIGAMTGMIEDLSANTQQMHALASQGYSTATDLADWLVRTLKMPFRKAHHVTANIVKLATEKNCDLTKLSLADMQKIEPRITKEAFQVLSVEQSVASRTSFGGTAPARVREALAAAKVKYL